MASYYLVISFVIYIIIDYITIYSFVDSNLLYSTSGTKLNYEVSKKKNFKDLFQELEGFHSLDYLILFVVFVVISVFLSVVSLYIFGVNPLYLKLFYKTINLTTVFSTSFSSIKIIYNVAQIIFCLIVTWKFRYYILKKAKEKVGELIYPKQCKEEYLEEGFVIARDENDECFYLSEQTLYQNLLITGSIGSGKTSGAITRICYNLIKSGRCGLILDVKGNFVDSVKEMCIRTNREQDLKIISKKSNSYFNILTNTISPLELAAEIKQVIMLLSTTNTSDPYWLDKVENVLMNLFVLMRFNYNKTEIMLLHRMVTEDLFLEQVIFEIGEKVKEKPPDEKTSFELSNAISFIQNEFKNLDGRVKSIIKSEITRFTIPLITEYEIYNQFCFKGEKEEIDFTKNQIVVLSLNIGENKALAKIIATCLKLKFQKYILSNISNKNPTFFIADEFQEFCNVQDSYFLSLSREAKCMNIISTQSYSSLRSALKDDNASGVIIQNLVNKIWFRNDDNYTISEAIKQLGKENIIRENKSISEASQESKKYMFKEGFKNMKSSISKTLNYVETKENKYDENFFSRELKTFEALAFISDGEKILEPKKIIFERWK